MTISVRAIALQGIGFGVAFVAAQGFAPVQQPIQQVIASAGSLSMHNPRRVTVPKVATPRQQFIHNQNHALITLVMAAAAEGVFL